MRDDFAKVIVERQRGGSNSNFRSIRKGKWYKFKCEDDVTPKSTGLRKTIKYHHGGMKSLNEHLSPMRGFLNKNVGRLWNDVYSEVRKKFKPTNATNFHIYQHLLDYVEQNTFMYKGHVYVHGRYYDNEMRKWSFGHPVEDSIYPWYVHPETGILSKFEKKRFKFNPPRRFYNYIKINDHQIIIFLCGVWYKLFLKERPPSIKLKDRATGFIWYASDKYTDSSESLFRDHSKWVIKYNKYASDDQQISTWAHNNPIPDGLYCYKINQLSKSELKNRGLKNETEVKRAAL